MKQCPTANHQVRQREHRNKQDVLAGWPKAVLKMHPRSKGRPGPYTVNWFSSVITSPISTLCVLGGTWECLIVSSTGHETLTWPFKTLRLPGHSDWAGNQSKWSKLGEFGLSKESDQELVRTGPFAAGLGEGDGKTGKAWGSLRGSTTVDRGFLSHSLNQSCSRSVPKKTHRGLY